MEWIVPVWRMLKVYAAEEWFLEKGTVLREPDLQAQGARYRLIVLKNPA